MIADGDDNDRREAREERRESRDERRESRQERLAMVDADNSVAVRVDRTADKLSSSVRLLVFLAVINLIVVIGSSVQVSSRNDTLHHIDDTQTKIQTAQEEIQVLADDLVEVTPDEQARTDAITDAVAIVPSIQEILCEAFPLTRPCQE